jgi:hypothetical protein
VKKKPLGFIEKPLGFIENRLIFSKTIPSTPVFVSFLLPVFFIFENRLVLFETCTFANIL